MIIQRIKRQELNNITGFVDCIEYFRMDFLMQEEYEKSSDFP